MCVFIVIIIFISSGEGPGNNGCIFVSIKHNGMFHDFWTKKQRHMTAYIWKYKILVHDHSWRRCFCLSIHFHKISVKLHAMTKTHLSLISSIATCSRPTNITLQSSPTIWYYEHWAALSSTEQHVFVSTHDYLSFQYVKTMTYSELVTTLYYNFEILQLFF